MIIEIDENGDLRMNDNFQGADGPSQSKCLDWMQEVMDKIRSDIGADE